MLKKYWPHLVILLLIAALWWVCNEPANPAQPVTAKQQALPAPQPRVYTNSKTGTVHTETKVVQAERDVHLSSYYESLLADMKAELKLKDKQIDRLTGILALTEGTISMKHDTLRVADSGSIAFSYADDFLQLAGVTGPEETSINYSLRDSIHLVSYWKQQGLFGKRELYVNGYSKNPATTLVGLQQVKITPPPPKKWAIGLQLGYGAGATGLGPYIGIGISRNLIRF
jgi:hypothetical protein